MMYLFLQTSKEMIPLGLEFPASLGGEDVFFLTGSSTKRNKGQTWEMF